VKEGKDLSVVDVFPRYFSEFLYK